MIKKFVYIVESPSAEDVLAKRAEARSLSAQFELHGIDHEHCHAVTRDTFHKALNKNLIDAIKKRHGESQPIIHISAHGNTDGIGLTDGTVLTWDDIRDDLRGLTRWTGGQSLICMSSCKGYFGIRMAMFEGDDPPFGLIVSNHQDATWRDLAIGFQVFYHQLFKGTPIADCVVAMRLASGDPNFCFQHGAEVKADWASFTQQQMRKTYADALLAPAPPVTLGGLAGIPAVQQGLAGPLPQTQQGGT